MAVSPLGSWSRSRTPLWPVAGAVSQPFGPSALVLEPPVVYRGLAFAHFHDAIDIATPLGISVHDHIIVGKNGHTSMKGLRLI